MAYPSKTFRANSSIALLDLLRRSARARNGGTESAPQLTNAGLLQLAEYFRAHDATGWDKLARIALGFFREGDRFQAGSKFSKAHATQPVGAVLLPALWGKMLGMATGIDARGGGAQQFTPSSGLSPSFWNFMAGAAFKILERERGKKAPAAVPPAKRNPIIVDPRDPTPIKPPPIPGRGGKSKLPIGIIVIAALVFVAMKKRK